ncbi:MAG: hypothetical protein H0U57_14760 [Tatlockia sp.]|nr:hypothetical protein [Tatlockia sp.]
MKKFSREALLALNSTNLTTLPSNVQIPTEYLKNSRYSLMFRNGFINDCKPNDLKNFRNVDEDPDSPGVPCA